MATPFEVLAEPVRRHILDLLRERPRSVGELTEQLGLTQPGTSKHLRVLRDAGLVRVRPEAQRRWYELCPEPLAELDAWLAPYRWMWSSRIDALEQHLNSMPSGSDTSAGPEPPPADEPPPPAPSGAAGAQHPAPAGERYSAPAGGRRSDPAGGRRSDPKSEELS